MYCSRSFVLVPGMLISPASACTQLDDILLDTLIQGSGATIAHHIRAAIRPRFSSALDDCAQFPSVTAVSVTKLALPQGDVPARTASPEKRIDSPRPSGTRPPRAQTLPTYLRDSFLAAPVACDQTVRAACVCLHRQLILETRYEHRISHRRDGHRFGFLLAGRRDAVCWNPSMPRKQIVANGADLTSVISVKDLIGTGCDITGDSCAIHSRGQVGRVRRSHLGG